MILFFGGLILALLCAGALFWGFYLTRYDFSGVRMERFDALCARLCGHKRACIGYAALGGALICGVFGGACLFYAGLYALLTGFPLVLLPLSRAMLILLLAAIAVLGALLIARHVTPLHLKIYQNQHTSH